jgi:hypothetical protein
MHIYKIINKVNGRWYIGKHNGSDPNYMGSGKLLRQAQHKYGLENFEKIILETVESEEQLNEREKHWIASTNAVNDSKSYNLASGGDGGNLSKYIDYDNRQYTIPNSERFKAAREWLDTLTPEERKQRFERQGMARTKGWYVSRVDDPTETYVQNISKWCEENGVDKSMPTALNKIGGRLFQKQTKGWRIRRSDMPKLPPYKNLRYQSTDNNCKGRTWKLVDGKRVWLDKY